MDWGKTDIKLFAQFISIDNLEAGGYLNVYTDTLCAYRCEDISSVHRNIYISVSVTLCLHS